MHTTDFSQKTCNDIRNIFSCDFKNLIFEDPKLRGKHIIQQNSGHCWSRNCRLRMPRRVRANPSAFGLVIFKTMSIHRVDSTSNAAWNLSIPVMKLSKKVTNKIEKKKLKRKNWQHAGLFFYPVKTRTINRKTSFECSRIHIPARFMKDKYKIYFLKMFMIQNLKNGKFIGYFSTKRWWISPKVITSSWKSFLYRYLNRSLWCLKIDPGGFPLDETGDGLHVGGFRPQRDQAFHPPPPTSW